MDLYAIHKSFLDMQSDFGRSSDNSDIQRSGSRDLEMARLSKLINMEIFKGIVPSNRQTTYDINYDSSDSDEDIMAPLQQLIPNLNNRQQQQQRPSSTEFNPSLLLPFGIRGASNQNNLNSANHSGSSRVTLADQFTWGAVVCAGVFVVVFICVMAAWWVHKKQQVRVNRRTAQREARRQMAEGAPYCIENDLRGGPDNVPIGDIQRPPSYFEVIGFFDPPPSYNDISHGDSCSHQQLDPNQQAYDNVVVTMDELPPPFMEADYLKSGEKIVVDDSITETSAISSLSPNTVVTVIPGREGHQDGSNS